MSEFFSKNAALLIALLALLVNITVQWDVIKKRIINNDKMDNVPSIVYRLLVISLSGTIAASLFWLMIDFLSVRQLSLTIILFDIASGAAWGIPIALLSGILSKSADGAVVTGVLISIIILLLSGPEKILALPQTNFSQKQIYSIVLFLLVLNIGVVCGYTGFRARSYIDGVSAKSSKS